MGCPPRGHDAKILAASVAVVTGIAALGVTMPRVTPFAVVAAMATVSALVLGELRPILPAESRRRALLDATFSVLIIAGAFWNLLLVLGRQPRYLDEQVAVVLVVASLLAPTALAVTGRLNDPTEVRFRRLAIASGACVVAGMAWAIGPVPGAATRPFAVLAVIGAALLLRALLTTSTGTRPSVDVLARLERRQRVVSSLHVLYVGTLVVAMWTTTVHEIMGTIAALVLVLAFVTQHAAGRENHDLHRQLATRLGELEVSENLLRVLAATDGLTGLFNRRTFVELLDEHLARRHPCAVLFIDLDRFKEINDSLGHEAGDEVLKEVSRRLRQTFGPTAMIGRFGGDEFVVLLPDTSIDGTAVAWGRRLLAVLSEPTTIQGIETFLAASIGVAESGAESTAGDLLRDADVAMYAAKETGRNRVAVFDPVLLVQAEERLHVANELHRGLAAGEFEPYFQPIVEVEGGRLRGFEALVRWHHPVRGLLTPESFLDVAEDTGVIVPMGAQVLEAACGRLGDWTRRGLISADVGVAVNFSPRQLLERGVVSMVSGAIVEAGIDAQRLTIEITESALMSEGTEVDTAIRRLRELGVRFSIDDFGTGYSSLAYLKRFPVDTIKIDRDFVDGLPADSGDAVIVDVVIGLANSLGLDTVAEGVERLDQLEYLRKRGCSRMQGYLISPALRADVLESWLCDAPSTWVLRGVAARTAGPRR